MKGLYRRIFGGTPQIRALRYALVSLVCNLAYAFYHGALGLLRSSIWLGTLCIYYLLLALMRFTAVFIRKRQRHALRATGVLLCFSSLVLSALLYLSLSRYTAAIYGTVPMITIAAYTFAKLTMAIVTALQQGRKHTPEQKMIHSIRCSQAAFSLLTMQQSMLLSFGDGTENSLGLNLFTGISVCLFTLFSGTQLLLKSRKEASYGKIQNCKSR